MTTPIEEIETEPARQHWARAWGPFVLPPLCAAITLLVLWSPLSLRPLWPRIPDEERLVLDCQRLIQEVQEKHWPPRQPGQEYVEIYSHDHIAYRPADDPPLPESIEALTDYRVFVTPFSVEIITRDAGDNLIAGYRIFPAGPLEILERLSDQYRKTDHPRIFKFAVQH